MPLISDSIGRVLGNRYRLISALGSGASAHVYLAEDVILQRLVAVKVLQPALARDEGFLRRFRAEARAVAALNHPHVVRVFDWGEDEGGPYLVVEHLGGGSLRHVLDRGVRLDPAQAARVGAQVADALAYAHARGLVHRDVKPANLLFDEEGRVRVADFGVARALAEAAWTEPAGAMIGTARYASPEQAEGRSVDGKADVYALGLVLFEALTGEVPFSADTTTATLRARVGAALPPHPGLGPLQPVLVRAVSPDAPDRLDAAELSSRLAELGDALPPAAPLPLPGADATTAMAPFDEGTAMAPPVPVAVDQPTRAEPAVAGPARARRRRWPWAVAALVVLMAAAAAFVVATKAYLPTRKVPHLVHGSLAAARRAISGEHLRLAVGPAVHSVSVPAGSVVRQTPAPGTALKQGSTVTVVPSDGPPSVAVPSLAGTTCAVATRLLHEAHLEAACPALKAYTDTKPAGQVINWSYAKKSQLDPTSAPYGATISVAVSLGHHPVPVPSLKGQTWTQAGAALKAVGLVAQEAQTFSTTVPDGQVIATTPVEGTTAPYGSTVLVKVSKGPQTVLVPTVAGDSVAKATAVLQKTGLTVGPVYGPGNGKIFTSVPLAGQKVKVGTAITLYTE